MLKQNFKYFFLFLIVGFAVYSNSFGNGFVFSDHYLILENYLVRSFGFVQYYFKGYISPSVKGAFRPLTMLSYNLNYYLSSYDVFSYRVLNIFIHCVNAFLIFLILMLLFPRGNKKSFFVAALIFLLHPINNEAVNHLMARSDILLTFFILFSFYFFIRGIENRKFTAISCLFYIFALLSKENAILFSVVLFVFLLFLKRDKISKFIPFFIISSIFLTCWKYWKLGIFTVSPAGLKYSSWFLNFLTQTKTLWYYLKLFFIPRGFSFDHDWLRVNSVFEPMPWVCLGLMVIILFFVFKADKKIKFSVFWLLCFYSWKFFIQLESVGREHHFYLPQIGLIFIVAVLLDFLVKKNKSLLYLLFILPLFLGSLTYFRNNIWHDETTVSLDILTSYPKSQIANYQLALKLRTDNRYQDAIKGFRHVLAIGNNPQLELKSLINLSEINLQLGDVNRSLKIAKDIFRKYPDSAASYRLLERIYLNHPEMDFDKLAADFPRNRMLKFYLADYWFRKGDFKKSEQYLVETVNSGVDTSGVYLLSGIVKQRLGFDKEAVPLYEKALLKDPLNKEAYFYLGTIMLQEGNRKGELFLKKAIQLDPYFAAAYFNLGVFYFGIQDKSRALFYLNKARDLGYIVPAGLQIND